MKISRWALCGGVFVVSLGVIGIAAYRSIPDVGTMKGCITTKMFSYYLCSGSSAYVPLGEISPHVVNAIIVSEDGSFYEHHGFDWFEIKQTIEKNLEVMDYSRGGSTITQQLAKNVFLSAEKSLLRKIREAILTVQIEKQFSKRQILEKYLNVVEFGPKIFGVKSAARHYFNKSPGELDILESAFLAFLLPSPKRHNQSFMVKNLTPFARKRLAQIIARMARFRKITDDEKIVSLEKLGATQWLNDPVIDQEFIPEENGAPIEVESSDTTESSEPIEPSDSAVPNEPVESASPSDTAEDVE